MCGYEEDVYMAKYQNSVAGLVQKSNVLKTDPNAAETLHTKGFGTKKDQKHYVQKVFWTKKAQNLVYKRL